MWNFEFICLDFIFLQKVDQFYDMNSIFESQVEADKNGGVTEISGKY